jgi:5-methylcytosine-specific restriction endonuclease McrA
VPTNRLPKAARRIFGLRNRLLQQLGWLDYRDYLESETWATIRARKLEAWPTCYSCGRPANEIHHQAYTREALLGEADYLLWTVCAPCHRAAEVVKGHRVKLPPAATSGRLKQWRMRRIKASTLWNRLTFASA